MHYSCFPPFQSDTVATFSVLQAPVAPQEPAAAGLEDSQCCREEKKSRHGGAWSGLNGPPRDRLEHVGSITFCQTTSGPTDGCRTLAQSKAMAPEERNDLMETSSGARPTKGPTVVMVRRSSWVRMEVEMAHQDW